MKISFSTVACPQWTAREVADAAEQYGFEGVELRSFGDDPSRLASDPSLTDADKMREIFGDDGIRIVSIGTGCRFDAPVDPPVIGRVIGDFEKSVREAKRHTGRAHRVGAPLIRVFALEAQGMESRKAVLGRIIDRLKLVADDARHSGVRIAVENGGDFCTAADLAEIIELVGSPLLGASYSVAVGHAAGDGPEDAIETLGDDLLLARVKDHRDGVACLPGDGETPCEAFTKALVRSGYEGALVFEWDRLWDESLAPAEEALPEAAHRLYGWAQAEAKVLV